MAVAMRGEVALEAICMLTVVVRTAPRSRLIRPSAQLGPLGRAGTGVCWITLRPQSPGRTLKSKSEMIDICGQR